MPLPTAADRHHPGRSCGPCELCGCDAHQYSHPEDWDDNHKELLSKIAGIPQNRSVFIHGGRERGREGGRERERERERERDGGVKPNFMCILYTKNFQVCVQNMCS